MKASNEIGTASGRCRQGTTASFGQEGGTPLVLLIDDEPFMLRTVRDCLEQVGCRVVEASSGREGLAAFQRETPDLVLLDIVMPEMDGFAVCKGIRQLPEGANAPVLIMTGLEDPDAIHQAFDAGATDFIIKPIQPTLLFYRMKYLLRASRNYERLLQSEAKLAQAQDIARLGYWSWTPDSDHLWLSDSACRLLDLSEREFQGNYDSLLSLFHPADRPDLDRCMQRGRAGFSFEIECRSVRRDGSIGMLYVQGGVAANPRGKGTLFGTLQDITEKWKFVRHLRLLEAAVESLPIGITISSPEGQILYSNAAEAEIHGYSPEELKEQVASHLFAPPELRHPLSRQFIERMSMWKRESTNVRKSGERFPVQLTSLPVRSATGETIGMVTACEDITERKAAAEKIERLAYYDLLTELPNRALFLGRLQEFFDQARGNGVQVALLSLDLDRFKDVNDTIGHSFGDQLLKAVAQRLVHCMRKADIVARLGGDEFFVVQTSTPGAEGPASTALRIIETISSPYELHGRRVDIGVSIGIALYPADGQDVETLMRNADLALYRAKELGRRRYSFYSEELNRRVQERTLIEARLREALDRGGLTLAYQPQIDLRTGTVVGAEALVRWQDPAFGTIIPDRFITIAEESGLIHTLGEWVLREACREMKPCTGANEAPLRIAVNISGHQFKQSHFTDLVDRILRETGLPPERLELELTENILMDGADDTVRILRDLKGRGIRLSIDDFGTGYSSLNYLKHFPMDRLKIDRSFLGEVRDAQDSGAIIGAITAMAHSLRMKVVAEGVESREQLDFLRRCSCDEAQGFLLSPPLSSAEFFALLAQPEAPPAWRVLPPSD